MVPSVCPMHNSISHHSVQFSHSVVSDCLWPHGLQHARLPCPSPTPRAHSNSCPLCQWCHPTISSSVGPFSSCLQCFPASGFFPMSRFFASGSQSIGARQWVNVFVLFLTKDDISLFFAENTEDQRPKSFHHILNENWPLPKLCIYQLPNCLPPFPTYSPCPSSTFC